MNSKRPASKPQEGRERPILGALAEFAEQDTLEEEPFDPEKTYFDLAPHIGNMNNQNQDVQFICEVKTTCQNNNLEVQKAIMIDLTEDDDLKPKNKNKKAATIIDLTKK